jgi:tRNA 2-thiocytidine biosynthesis protein TtcA
MELDREHPDLKQSLLKSLANVQPRHLLDRRLNPPGAPGTPATDSEPTDAAPASPVIPLEALRR